MQPFHRLILSMPFLLCCGVIHAAVQNEPGSTIRSVTVTVVDDLGDPVPDAVLVRVPGTDPPAMPLADPYLQGRQWSRWGVREEHTTNAQGRATVHVPADEALMLAVHGPRHVFSAMAVPASAVSSSVQLVATRGGFVCGRLEAQDLFAHARVSVCGIREDGPKRDDRWPGSWCTFGALVDTSGSFRSGPIEPGRYRIGIHIGNAVPFRSRQSEVPEPIPILSDDDFALPPVTVDIAPGTEHPLSLVTPVCGELTGRVLAAGKPVANAIVCSEWEFLTRRLAESDPDDYEYRDHCRTDAEGRFRFLIGSPGTFELQARLAQGISWSAPITLTFPTTATRLEHDFRAPTAAIRGALGEIPGRHSHRLEIRLYPLADAGDGPPHPGVDVFDPKWVPMTLAGESDAFAFAGLTPGRWVLRVGEEHRARFWRIVTTTDDEVTEIGTLEPPETVPVELACVLPKGYCVELRQRVHDSEHEVFVERLAPGKDRLVLGSIPPGSYRLHAQPWWWGRRIGGGKAPPKTRRWIDLEVQPDGACVPARVDFTLTEEPDPGR